MKIKTLLGRGYVPSHGIEFALQEVFSHPYEPLPPELANTYDRLKPEAFFGAGGVSHYSCSS